MFHSRTAKYKYCASHVPSENSLVVLMTEDEICAKCKRGKIALDTDSSESYCGMCGYVIRTDVDSESCESSFTNSDKTYQDTQREAAKRKASGRCKGICLQYKAMKPRLPLGRYDSGQVKCQTCQIYMTNNGCNDKNGNTVTGDAIPIVCKCCGYRVRTKPRGRLYKDKLVKRLEKNE